MRLCMCCAPHVVSLCVQVPSAVLAVQYIFLQSRCNWKVLKIVNLLQVMQVLLLCLVRYQARGRRKRAWIPLFAYACFLEDPSAKFPPEAISGLWIPLNPICQGGCTPFHPCKPKGVSLAYGNPPRLCLVGCVGRNLTKCFRLWPKPGCLSPIYGNLCCD